MRNIDDSSHSLRYVGDAINGDAASAGSTCPVIALGNWGIVKNSEKLATYPDGKPVQGGLVYYGRITDKSEGLCLDQNHSHYIVVDGGKKMGFGDEIASRAAIEFIPPWSAALAWASDEVRRCWDRPVAETMDPLLVRGRRAWP